MNPVNPVNPENHMPHNPITSDRLPRPVGPYSPGMAFERLIFVSGQGATDPATGQLAGLDIETQTEQALANVATILEAAGSIRRPARSAPTSPRRPSRC